MPFSRQILNGSHDFFLSFITMKGLDTVESLSAGAARDPNRNMGTVIIYIFVTFTHSNILLGSSWKSILESVNVTKI